MSKMYPKIATILDEDVLSRLRRAIVTCEILPGAKLVQDELAAQFGISRLPIREALRTLEGEGLVMMRQNYGATCRPLEAKDLHDLYDVRAALEELACRNAADRFFNGRELVVAKFKLAAEAIKRRDLTTLVQLDWDFHLGIAAGADNGHLVRSLTSNWLQIARAMHYFLKIESCSSAKAWTQHQALGDALSTGDSEAAARLIRFHIIDSRKLILKHLREP